jgi:hypothetical protein
MSDEPLGPGGSGPSDPPPPSTPPATVPAAPDPTPTVPATPPPSFPPASPPVAAPTAEVPRPPDRDRRTLLLGAAAALFFVLFLLAGPLGLWPSSAQLGGTSAAEAKGEIETVATRFARNLVNFSYKTLDRDLARVQRDATGNFENEFSNALGSIDTFRDAIKKAKATSRGTVKGTIISTQTTEKAIVIVYLTQSVSHKSDAKPRTLPRFLQLTLVKAGSWKVDDVKQLEIRAA